MGYCVINKLWGGKGREKNLEISGIIKENKFFVKIMVIVRIEVMRFW